MEKEKRDALLELRNVIYNAEDVIDGEYSPENEYFSEFAEINISYARVLNELRGLLTRLDKELEKTEQN